MPCRYGSTPQHRVSVELIEADLDAGFCLVDLAEETPAHAPRLLTDAERLYTDITARLARLEANELFAFAPLVVEFRRAIDRLYHLLAHS